MQSAPSCVRAVILLAGTPALTGAQAAPGLAVAAEAATPVVTRDAEGRIAVRAVRVTEVRIDGRLDETIYTMTGAITDCVQQEPDEGRPATEKTE